MKQLIIGITGTISAGKGTIVDYLLTKGFVHFSARNFITQEIKRRNMPVDRDSMNFVGTDLRAQFGGSHICKELYKEAVASGKNAVIESFRTVDEANFLKDHGAYLFFIDADIQTRYERACNRGSETDQVSFERFKEQEERESRSEDPSIMNLRKCKELTDPKYRFNNDGTLEELHAQIDKALQDLL